MELFLIGLFIGIAVGMWGAILLYRLSGKAEPGWPFRRKQGGNTSSSKAMSAGPPADDFTEEYYAQQESQTEQAYAPQASTRPSTQPKARPVPPPAQRPATSEGDVVSSDAGATIVYTEEELGADMYTSAQAGAKSAEAQRNAGVVDAEGVGEQQDTYTTLLTLMKGDIQATEALIEAERQRTPAVARPRLIENALLRLQYSQE